MRNKWLGLGLGLGLVFAIIVSLFPVSANAANNSLSVSGVSISWADTIYLPEFSALVQINYANQSGRELLELRYTVTDKFGGIVASNSKIGLSQGVVGTMSDTWYGSNIVKNNAPFTMTLSVQNYTSSGLGSFSVSKEFIFTDRIASQPQPAPTVTITAQPQPAPTVTITAQPVVVANQLTKVVEGQKRQIASLAAKILRICKYKPKPKGC